MFSTILAEIGNPVITGGDSTNATSGTTFISAFLPKIITIIFIVGSVAFFFMLLIGGVRWVTSGGDKTAVEGARTQIVQALIGLLILVSVWAIAKLLQNVLGINLLNIDLTSILA